MVADLFAGWTPAAMFTALASGLGLGIVASWIRVDTRRFLFLLTAFALLWYVPQAARLLMDPQPLPDPLRTLGVGLLMLVLYVLPAWAVALWRSRGSHRQ